MKVVGGPHMAPAAGVGVRLARMFAGPQARCGILTLDAALIYGTGPRRETLGEICAAAYACGATGVLGFPATLERLRIPSALSRIALLSASTTAGAPLDKVLVSSVEGALRIGADALAVQFHLGALAESSMLERLGTVAERAHALGLPLIVTSYARSETGALPTHRHTGKDEADYCPHTHAACVAIELGADAVKVQFCGDISCLEHTVSLCAPVPILVAGGDLRNLVSWGSDMKSALRSGARGLCVGRNVVHRGDWGAALQIFQSALVEPEQEAESKVIGLS
ncbi:MAG TPA: hypothetical protein VIJ39_12335 [Solirubrobacteraceae bacterium]